MKNSVTLMLYNIFITYLVPYVVKNFARLGLTTQQRDDLSAFLIDWAVKYEAYINPVTKGDGTTKDVNAQYLTMLAYTDGIKQQIKNNRSVVLTVWDYLVLLIHQNNPRSRSKIPAQRAGCVVKSTTHLNNEFQVIDLDNMTKAGKPAKVLRISRRMLVQDHGKPFPTLDQLIAMDDEGSMGFDVPFDFTQIGMDGYMVVCFTNDAGQGTWSAILPFSII